jgi:hypothetical protein
VSLTPPERAELVQDRTDGAVLAELRQIRELLERLVKREAAAEQDDLAPVAGRVIPKYGRRRA